MNEQMSRTVFKTGKENANDKTIETSAMNIACTIIVW